MKKNAYVVFCLAVTLVGIAGCSNGKSAKEATKAAAPRDKIQGKAQVVLTETNATDSALSAGGASVYLWQGDRRYRLFLKTPYEFEGGKEYIVQGVHAQKVIDEIGDPDGGKNGYPLVSSCRRVINTAWPGMSLDAIGSHSSTLRARVSRYPARPVFLVTNIEAAPEKKDKSTEQEKAELPEISVPAEKQKALLTAGQTVRPAPLWEPAGGSVRCKVAIDKDGKISELRTGAQLCEAVPWSEFQFQPTLQRGRPVNVATEIEIRFEPRK